MMDKPGRNDPCYCGSGKKYKQCHMKIDKEQENIRRQKKQAATFLRRDLMRFARDERFAAGFSQALPFYWNEMYDLESAEEMSQPEAMRFFDWFVFDYELPDGGRVLDVYREEVYEDLSQYQQMVLEDWMEARPAGAYKLTDYDSGALYLEDFMTGESFEVHEGGGRGSVEIGEVILTRLVKVHDHFEFSTTAAYLPADEIADLAEKLEAAKAAYQAEHPDADQDDFMRRHNHLLVHHALAQAELKERAPVARLDADRPDKKMQKMVQAVKKRVK